MSILRDQFLSQKAKTKVISVPGFPSSIRIQEMTVGRRLAFFEVLAENAKAIAAHDKDPENNPYVKPIDEALLGFVLSVVDDDDNLVLKVEDIDSLHSLPYYAIQQIYLEAMALGHMSSTVEEVLLEKKD